MLRVTVDTNVLSRDMERIRAATDGLDVEIAPTTVTLRERGEALPAAEPVPVAESVVYGESRYDSGAVYGSSPIVYETAVVDEWRIGSAVVGDENARTRFEAILSIIGSGSFPPRGEREAVSETQRRQLRDAMILEAHARDHRDVLVSNDEKAYIRHGRRERLEALCRTKIRTVDEFCAEAPTLACQAPV